MIRVFTILAFGILLFLAPEIYAQEQLLISADRLVVVGFEATILFAVFGNVIGLLTQMRLPNDGWLKYYDPRCSGEHFGVLATCEAHQKEGLEDFFKQRGAEVTIF